MVGTLLGMLVGTFGRFDGGTFGGGTTIVGGPPGGTPPGMTPDGGIVMGSIGSDAAAAGGTTVASPITGADHAAARSTDRRDNSRVLSGSVELLTSRIVRPF